MEAIVVRPRTAPEKDKRAKQAHSPERDRAFRELMREVMERDDRLLRALAKR